MIKWLAKDKWLTIDKLYHFIGLVILTIVTDYQTALAIGFGKECMDIPRSGFSYKDLIAGYLGVGLVILVKTIISWYF